METSQNKRKANFRGLSELLIPPSAYDIVKDTVESRFLEPPGETQFGSRNREFEKSEVASNYA